MLNLSFLTIISLLVFISCCCYVVTANQQQADLGLPTNLCQEDAVAFNGLLNDTTNSKFYFFSYDLCKQTTLNPSIDSNIVCGKGEWQIAQLDGNNYPRLYNNSDCGRLYANSTVLSRNDSSQITVKFYNEPTTTDVNYVLNNISTNF